MDTELTSSGNFCYCTHTWAAQLMEEYSILISLSHLLVQVIRVFCVFSRLFIAEGMDGVETSGRDEQQQLTRNHGGLFEHQPLSLKKFFMQKY